MCLLANVRYAPIVWSGNESTQRQAGPADAIRVVRFATLDSTSSHARALVTTGRAGGSPVALVAQVQTSGIGRFKRAWSSPSGGLWMTLAWPADESTLHARLDGLGLRVGVACLRVVREAFHGFKGDPHVRLKWPNDVLVHGRKVLGVLTELVHEPAPDARPWLLVGVGLNANIRMEDLEEPMRSHATSLQRELGHPVQLELIEAQLLRELAAALSASGLSRQLLTEACDALHGLDRDTTVSLPDGTRMSGVLKGLNEHGMAVLDIDGRVFVPPLGAVIMSDTPPRRDVPVSE